MKKRSSYISVYAHYFFFILFYAKDGLVFIVDFSFLFIYFLDKMLVAGKNITGVEK